MLKNLINKIVIIVNEFCEPPPKVVHVVDPNREQERYVTIDDLAKRWPEINHQQIDLLHKFLYTDPEIKDTTEKLYAKAGAYSVITRLHALVERQKAYTGESTIKLKSD